ncbi:MAG: ABC transporter ATP-binding protein [Elusimicrobia bacterium]|nr:ABC transporter ATP-binding protein [Elusimicrobiota bacterium]
MSKPIIEALHLSKRYAIGARQSYGSLREEIMQAVAAPFKALASGLGREAAGGAEVRDAVWALDDVSFEVRQGDVLGIIGRNGAGKSTLLKILSRITEPTSGRVTMRGRTASLLDVGTGFHPELTGRENIFLNGSLLGMSSREVRSKLDEIVDFSEIALFLDTPVKRYSSGMYVRLAFAVAAHLEPEILIVDEALAVGDAAFQKKCLGKMGEAAKGGRTVLLVSHNMDVVSALCSHGLLLKEGKAAFAGGAQECVDAYVRGGGQGKLAVDLSAPGLDLDRSGPRKHADIREVSTLDGEGGLTDAFMMGEPFVASAVVAVKGRVLEPEVGFCISTPRGARLHHLVSGWGRAIGPLDAGVYRFRARIPELNLYPGGYTLTVWFRAHAREGVDDFVEAPLSFSVIKSRKAGAFADFTNVSPSGGVYVASRWDHERLSGEAA